jgi:hypothetical protein
MASLTHISSGPQYGTLNMKETKFFSLFLYGTVQIVTVLENTYFEKNHFLYVLCPHIEKYFSRQVQLLFMKLPKRWRKNFCLFHKLHTKLEDLN